MRFRSGVGGVRCLSRTQTDVTRYGVVQLRAAELADRLQQHRLLRFIGKASAEDVGHQVFVACKQHGRHIILDSSAGGVRDATQVDVSCDLDALASAARLVEQVDLSTLIASTFPQP